MSETVKLKISSSVAAYVRPGSSRETKLLGVQAASAMEPSEQVTLLFCLGKDPDVEVKEAAHTAFASLPLNILLACTVHPDTHPALLGEIARVHGANAMVAEELLKSDKLAPAARDHVISLQPAPHPETEAETAAEPESSTDETGADVCASHDSEAQDMDDASLPPDEDERDDYAESPEESSEAEYGEVDEGGAEYLSKFKLIQLMGIGEKIKMALTGDKEWRAILVKDANKLVSAGVMKNPRITESEVLRIIKMGVQNDEVIRIICSNREWIKNYQIRKALIDCPKTPLANSLRYLSLLGEKDLASYAKSKNVSSVVSTQAKRMLLQKQKKR